MEIRRLFERLGLAAVIGILLCGPIAQSQPPQAGPKAGGVPISLEKINAAQFKALPLSAMVLYRGKVMAKSDFIAARIREWHTQSIAVRPSLQGAGVPPQLDAVKAKFVQERLAEVAAMNAALQTEFEKAQQDLKQRIQTPQYAALAKEASELRDRFGRSSPDEQAKIKLRATEVYSQLVQIEQSTTTSRP